HYKGGNKNHGRLNQQEHRSFRRQAHGGADLPRRISARRSDQAVTLRPRTRCVPSPRVSGERVARAQRGPVRGSPPSDKSSLKERFSCPSPGSHLRRSPPSPRWRGARVTEFAAQTDSGYGDPSQKNASVRISMLSRGRALGGEVGSSNAVCADQRARPSFAESKTLNTSASSRRMRGR